MALAESPARIAMQQSWIKFADQNSWKRNPKATKQQSSVFEALKHWFLYVFVFKGRIGAGDLGMWHDKERSGEAAKREPT